MASADKDKLGADLSAYLDGELSPERARQIEQLLAESEEARRTLADLRAISQGLADLPRRRAPEGLPEMVRRSSERQVLLPERPSTGRTRVLKLFARLSASAALIAACVFAGWTVFERTTRPAPTGAESEIVAGEARAPVDDGVERFAHGLSADERARSEITANGAFTPLADAPALAMGDAMAAPEDELHVGRGRAGGILVKKTPSSESETPPTEEKGAPAEEVFVAAAAPPVPDVTPAVSVVVTPRDAEQYHATVRTVATWQAAAPVTGGAAVRYAFGALTTQEFTVQVPPARVNELLLSLEQQAPQQVQVAMRFSPQDIAQVQRMVMPAEAVPPGADRFVGYGTPARERGAPTTPETAATERLAGRAGARGRVIRGTADQQLGVPAQPEKSKPAVTPELPEAADAHVLQQLKALGHVGKSLEGEEARRAPSADEKKESSERRRVPGAAAEAPTGGRSAPAPAEPADKLDAAERRFKEAPAAEGREPPSPPLFVRDLRDGALRIRDRLGQVYEMMLDVALRRRLPEDQPAPTPTAPVTLRVTLLPPPQAAPQPTGPPENGPGP